MFRAGRGTTCAERRTGLDRAAIDLPTRGLYSGRAAKDGQPAHAFHRRARTARILVLHLLVLLSLGSPRWAQLCSIIVAVCFTVSTDKWNDLAFVSLAHRELQI